MDIPKDKNFPENSVQCDNCGGHGCDRCIQKGWLTPKDNPFGRWCERSGCLNTIRPDNVAVYCSNRCASLDAIPLSGEV